MEETALPRIEKSIWLPTEVALVWEHLTKGELLELWFGGTATIEARRGGRVELDAGDGSLRWGTVEDLEVGRRIQWSWRTGEGDPSLVVIELAAEDDGVRMVVTETLLEYRMEYHASRFDVGLRWLA